MATLDSNQENSPYFIVLDSDEEEEHEKLSDVGESDDNDECNIRMGRLQVRSCLLYVRHMLTIYSGVAGQKPSID
jgi:hypothetical protein